jgi:hypothetical protein
MAIKDITKTGAQPYQDIQKQNELYEEQNTPWYNLPASQRMQYHQKRRRETLPVEKVGYEEVQQWGDFGNSKYDVDVPLSSLQNLEAWRGENQSAGRQWLHGLGKGVGLAATTFIDGWVGLFYGLGSSAVSLAEGIANKEDFGETLLNSVSKIWDNDVSNALHEINQGMETWLPNYRTQEQQERNWLQNAGTANFWADGFLKNLGFTVGAYYSGAAYLKGLKALGWINKGASAQVVGGLLSGFNEARVEANNGQHEYLTLQNQLIDDEKDNIAMEIASNTKLTDAQKIEALKNLDANTDVQKQKALQGAHKMGLTTLIGNTIILSLDNMWQFGKLYSRGFTNAKGLIGRIEEGMMKQGIKGGVKEGGKYVAETVSKPRAVAKGFSNALVEGFEEMNQAAISSGAGYWFGGDSPDAYYEALKDPNAKVQTQNFLSAMGHGLIDTYGNGDRWEEFAIGFLTGAIGMPTFGSVNNADANTWLGRGRKFGISGGVIGEYRSQMQQSRENEESARVMNAYLDKLATNANYFSQSQSFTNAMDGFAASNNKFEYENMSNNDDFAAISRFAKTGRLDDLKELVNQDFENMSDEQLADIAVNTTPNIIRKDDGTVAYEDINGNVATGGWRDATGKLMSETPEGREQMREDLKAKRDKILYEIGEYEKSVEAVRAITNNSLPDDQVNELAWLDWKGKMFNSRYGQIQKKQEENLTSMLNASQRYSDRASQDFETYTNMMNAVKSEIRSISNDISETEDLIAGLNNDIANNDATPISEEHIGKLNEINSKIESIRRSKGMYARDKRRKAAQQQRLKESLENEIMQSKIALINDYQDYVDSQKRRLSDLQDAYWNDMDKNTVNEQEWEFGKYLQGIADEMTKFLSYIKSSDNPLQLASKIEANEEFISWAEDGVMKELLTSEMGITGEEYDRIMQDLKDTAMIAKTAKQFKERYDEFSKNPAKLVANRRKLDKAKEKVNSIIDKQKAKKSVNSKSVSDIVDAFQNGEVSADELNDLAEKLNGTDAASKVKTAQDIVSKKQEIRSDIVDSDLSKAEKDAALAALEDAKGEDLQETIDSFRANINDPEYLRNAGAEEENLSKAIADMEEGIKDFESLEVSSSELNDLVEKTQGQPTPETKNTVNEDVGHDAVDNNPSKQEQDKAKEEAQRKQENTIEYIAERDSERLANEAIEFDEASGHVVFTEEEKKEIKEDTKEIVKHILESQKEGKSYENLYEEVSSLLESDEFDLTDYGEAAIFDYIDELYGKVEQDKTEVKSEEPVLPQPEETYQVSESDLDNAVTPINKSIEDNVSYEYYKPQQSLLPFGEKRKIDKYDFTPFYRIIEIIDKKEIGKEPLSKEEESIYNKYHGVFNYSEPYRKHIIAVGKYLNKIGAFSYIDNGNIKKGDVIGFTIDKDLNSDAGDVVVLITKNGQVIGSLPSLKYDTYTINKTPGLRPFLEGVIKQWNNSGKIIAESKVDKYMIGQIPFVQNERHTLNEVYGNESFNIGIAFEAGNNIPIKSNPGVTRNTLPTQLENDTMLALTAAKGQPFLLFKTGATGSRSYIPIPFIMPVLSDTTANTELGNLIKSKLESLPNYNNTTVIPVMQDIQELLSLKEFHVNYLNNGNIQISFVKHGTNDRVIFFNQPAANISQAFESLIKFGIPFQISRRYMNTTMDGRNYNRMIGEIANINLGVGSTHTISNWFTIDPVGADNVSRKATSPKSTYTNPNPKGGVDVSWSGNNYSVDLRTRKVFNNNGTEYTGSDVLEILAYTEGVQSGKDMTRPYVSKFAGENQLFDPITRKFVDKPAKTNDIATGINAGLDIPQEALSSEDVSDLGSLLDQLSNGIAPKATTSTTRTFSPEEQLITVEFARDYNGWFEGGGASIEDSYNIPKDDQYAAAIIRDFENTVMGDGILTFNLARRFLGVLEKYNPSKYKETHDLFLKGRQAQQAGWSNWSGNANNQNNPQVVYTNDITTSEGTKGAAQYDRATNTIKIDKDFLKQKFDEKVWTKPRKLIETIDGKSVESQSEILPEDTFTTYEEWEQFVVNHEYQHSLYPRESFDKEFPGKTKGDYETEINRRALEQLRSTQNPTISSSSRPTSEIGTMLNSLIQDNVSQETKLVESDDRTPEELREIAEDNGIVESGERSEDAWNALTHEQQVKLLNYSEVKQGKIMQFITESFENGKFNTTKLKGSVDSFLDNPKYRALDVKQESFDLKKETAWLKRVLPQFSDAEHLQLVEGLTKMGTNTEVYGMFKRGIILLNSQTQTRGTTYHEAFHAVFDTLLTDEERENVYKAGIKKFKKTGVALEEALAEDFRKYTQGIEYNDTKSGLAKAWRKLVSWIKRLFKVDNTLDTLYADINRGLYTNRIPKVTDAIRMYDKELEDIKSKAIADGTFMKAPNGKPTNLTEKQWLQVRTKNFINWFGDWINDPANASKVVDENGEPLVVYHGTNDVINDFNYNGSREWNSGFFFTSDIKYAQDIANKKSGNVIMPIFLNIKNPVITNTPIVSKEVEGIYVKEGNKKSDGIIGHDLKTGEFIHSNGTEYVVSRPNQIKSATDNVGTFSRENNDIRYREIENVNRNLTAIDNVIDNVDKDLRKILENEKYNLEYQRKQLSRSLEYKEWLSDLDNLDEADRKALLDFGLTKQDWQELDDDGRENALMCFGSF